jgi:hypothetical protein
MAPIALCIQTEGQVTNLQHQHITVTQHGLSSSNAQSPKQATNQSAAHFNTIREAGTRKTYHKVQQSKTRGPYISHCVMQLLAVTHP